MKKLAIALITLSALIFLSCKGEQCTISFEKNKGDYTQIVKEIRSLGIEMKNSNSYFRPVLTVRETDNIFSINVFDQIEFIECHSDSTVIFQAPNCTKGNAVRDVVKFLAYSPHGSENIRKKRNVGSLNKKEDNWFMGTHILTLAN